MLDILMVTYNSARWIRTCFERIAESAYDLSRVGIYVVDNGSTDETLPILEEVKTTYADQFTAFEIRKNEENVGFGTANNQAVAMGRGEILLFLNVDTEVFRDTIGELMTAVSADGENTGIWEMMQYPYEHPKLYDPVTGYTSWASGACFAMRRALFEQIGGFDEHIFMYAEDVDLSWRVRAEGYAIRYMPRSMVVHHSYSKAGEIKPNQYVYSLVYNLMLRLKFGSLTDNLVGCGKMARTLLSHTPVKQGRTLLIQGLFKALPAYAHAICWRLRNRKKVKRQRYSFIGWDYEVARDGAFFYGERLESGPKVSVLIRTCGRPDTLRETLMSVRAQTYRNIEIVVVEDGLDTSQQMIQREFSDLNIVYRATGSRVGRSAAGNLAMSLASGQYFNFLDDDDVFFADHVQTLVSEIMQQPAYKVAYSYAFDTPIRVLSRSPYRYEIEAYRQTVRERFNRLRLLHHNLFPIQAVMFAREVWQQLGGLDETLDMLEDWDMWVRYASRYDFLCVEKTTSIYRVPASSDETSKRQDKLDEALQTVRQKHHGYSPCWTMEQIQHDSIELIEQRNSTSFGKRIKNRISQRLEYRNIKKNKTIEDEKDEQ